MAPRLRSVPSPLMPLPKRKRCIDLHDYDDFPPPAPSSPQHLIYLVVLPFHVLLSSLLVFRFLRPGLGTGSILHKP
jgi:hypothetical protein